MAISRKYRRGGAERAPTDTPTTAAILPYNLAGRVRLLIGALALGAGSSGSATEVTYAVTLGRRAGTTGPIAAGCPLTPATVAAVAALGVSLTGAVRLHRLDTGAQIAIAPPTRLAGDVASLTIATPLAAVPDLAAGGALPCELRWSATAPTARVAAIGMTPVPDGYAWPTRAVDLIASGLWGLPLIPFAARGTLPTPYARLDDAYLAEHLTDVATVTAALVSDPSTTVITLLRGAPAQLMNDAEGQMIAEGCRRGGSVGHEMFAAAAARMDAWASGYADPITYNVPEATAHALSLPCLYWLTGADRWRWRTIAAANGAIMRGRYDLWQNIPNGDQAKPGNPDRLRSNVDLRQIANVILGCAAAARVDADLTTYPDASGDTTYPWYTRTFLDDTATRIFLAQQYQSPSPYAGSWGDAGDVTGTQAPNVGVPQIKAFEAHFALGALVVAYHIGGVSAGRKAQIRAAVPAGVQYLYDHTYVAPGVNGTFGHFAYVWPTPALHADGSQPTDNWAGNGDFGYSAESSALAGLATAWSYAVTGDATFAAQCDTAFTDSDANRYPGGVLASAYATGQLKKFDQAHYQTGVTLALRFGSFPIA